MNKHAYLIMAHDDIELLKYLLQMIDDPRNDIYLHMDKKYGRGREVAELEHVVRYSKLNFINRMDVRWGTYSQVDCEIKLLKEATKEPHSYYHLLSGHDLPIKTNDEIYKFFEENIGKEFISFYRPVINPDNLPQLSRYNFNFKFYRLILLSRKIQQFLNIDRVAASGMIYMKGGNWFSITHSLAQYVIEQEKKIKKMFNYTRCSDEIFLQTIVYNSVFKEKVYTDYNDIKYRTLNSKRMMSNLRTMDWPDELGTPHPRTLEKSDLEALKRSGAFWARKFDWRIDSEIIKEIYNTLSSK